MSWLLEENKVVDFEHHVEVNVPIIGTLIALAWFAILLTMLLSVVFWVVGGMFATSEKITIELVIHDTSRNFTSRYADNHTLTTSLTDTTNSGHNIYEEVDTQDHVIISIASLHDEETSSSSDSDQSSSDNLYQNIPAPRCK